MIVLLVETSAIVADDISETIREVWRDAAISIFATLSDARDWADGATRVDIAIFAQSYRDLQRDGLVHRLSEKGTGLILTGDAYIMDYPGLPRAIQVARPFTAPLIQDAIRRLLTSD